MSTLIQSLWRPVLLTRVLGLTVAFVAVVAVVGSAMVASSAVAPRNRAVGPAPVALEDVSIRTESGLRLSAWAHAADTESKFVAVLAHPLNATREAMVERAEFYRARGGVALLFDFRGHGHSDAARVTYGLQEADDLVEAVAFARGRWPSRKVVVDGWSLGAAAALVAGNRLAADALVLEAPYTDLVACAAGHLEGLVPVGANLAADLVLMHAPWAIGVDVKAVESADRRGALGVPMLFLVGTEDVCSKPDGVRAIAERMVDCRGVIEFAGAGPEDLLSEDRELFAREVGGFLDGLVSSMAGRSGAVASRN